MIIDHESIPTVVPAFDFDSYLVHLTGHKWTIQELSGGNANHTVRAIRTRENVQRRPRDCDTIGYVNGHTSIVLKQAPPYFVKFPDMLFSQDRQVRSYRSMITVTQCFELRTMS
jgi:hypothetical protein